jgi:hypothetical protein
MIDAQRPNSQPIAWQTAYVFVVGGEFATRVPAGSNRPDFLISRFPIYCPTARLTFANSIPHAHLANPSPPTPFAKLRLQKSAADAPGSSRLSPPTRAVASRRGLRDCSFIGTHDPATHKGSLNPSERCLAPTGSTERCELPSMRTILSASNYKTMAGAAPSRAPAMRRAEGGVATPGSLAGGQETRHN